MPSFFRGLLVALPLALLAWLLIAVVALMLL